MSAICAMCGQVWGGATLGKLWHCRSVKAVKPKARKREIVQVKEKQKSMCECGQIATTTSAVTSHSDKVCQRCHDCEKINQRNFGKGSDSIGATYKVRMPKRKSEF